MSRPPRASSALVLSASVHKSSRICTKRLLTFSQVQLAGSVEARARARSSGLDVILNPALFVVVKKKKKKKTPIWPSQHPRAVAAAERFRITSKNSLMNKRKEKANHFHLPTSLHLSVLSVFVQLKEELGAVPLFFCFFFVGKESGVSQYDSN